MKSLNHLDNGQLLTLKVFKMNVRNAGRKKVKDGVIVRLTIPKDKVQELKDFAKTLIVYLGIQGRTDK